jgi:hypothetical protein
MTTSPAAIVRAVDHIFPEEVRFRFTSRFRAKPTQNTEGLAVLPARVFINGSRLAPDNPSLVMERRETLSFGKHA